MSQKHKTKPNKFRQATVVISSAFVFWLTVYVYRKEANYE